MMQVAFKYDCTPRLVHFAATFTGKERDTESGNDYFGARYYGSSMGRFMSPDDGTGQHPNDPQSWNYYSYALNNPLRYIDPNGHSTHTADNGDVLAVYDDGDLGVYRHGDIDNFKDWDHSGLNSTDPETSKVGETPRWDEFAQLDKKTKMGIDGSHGAGAFIHFDESVDGVLAAIHKDARAEGSISTALDSQGGGAFDLKANRTFADHGALTGYLVGGKYITAESAGNFLAGYNAVSVGKISPEFAQKIFGAYQQGGLKAAVHTYRTGEAFRGTSAPYWGEHPYSGYMQVIGEHAAENK